MWIHRRIDSVSRIVPFGETVPFGDTVPLRRIVLFGEIVLFRRDRPLTRSWFRFWFFWQFNMGNSFDWLILLIFFSELNPGFYLCIFLKNVHETTSAIFRPFWKLNMQFFFWSCWTHDCTLSHFFIFFISVLTGLFWLLLSFFAIFCHFRPKIIVSTYWIYNELPKHWDSFQLDLWKLEHHQN